MEMLLKILVLAGIVSFILVSLEETYVARARDKYKEVLMVMCRALREQKTATSLARMYVFILNEIEDTFPWCIKREARTEVGVVYWKLMEGYANEGRSKKSV